ncbi:MAG: hypothetical protein RJB13_459 [Pseudomonadota bacterium]
MLPSRKFPYYIISTAVLSSTFALSCTKSKEPANNNQPPPQNQPINPLQPQPLQPNPTEILPLFRYTIASLAGSNVLCQDFSSRMQLSETDVQMILNSFAGRQAGIPPELPNPFNLQTLALKLQPEPCEGISSLLQDGHCAVTLSQMMATGQVTLETEQRVLWKDLPTLAQAIAVKTSLDSKASIIAGKNSILGTIQQQITQQKLLLQILQGAGNDSQLLKDAQNLLEQLQEQSKNLEGELGGLEREIQPLQDELEKRLDELRVARATLKQSCNVQTLGSAGASWKDN